MRRGFALLVVLAGCSSTPPSKVDGAPKRVPDESYETGGALAWRVLVWTCDARNERISMIQRCGEGLTGCGKWEVSRTLCPANPAGREATRTPGEDQLGEVKEKHPIPEGWGWR